MEAAKCNCRVRCALGLLIGLVVVLAAVDAVLLICYREKDVFYLLFSGSSSASFVASALCYLRHGLYNKYTMSRCIAHRNRYVIVLVFIQSAASLVAIIENVSYLLNTEKTVRHPGLGWHSLFRYCSAASAPLARCLPVLNQGIFIQEMVKFRQRLKRLNAFLEATRPEEFGAARALSETEGRVSVVLRARRRLQDRFSAPVLVYVLLDYFSAFICTGGLVYSHQNMTGLVFASVGLFIVLHLLTLGLLMEVSATVDKGKEEVRQTLCRLIRCCRCSARPTEAAVLKEFRKDFSGSFCLRACDFFALNRGAFLAGFGFLVSYCVILYQFVRM